MYIGALPAASNRGAYSQQFQLFDDENDDGIDLTGASIVFALRKPGHAAADLVATTRNGRIVLGLAAGVFELTLAAHEMRGLAPVTYEAGLTITHNGETMQYFIGTLPVIDGVAG